MKEDSDMDDYAYEGQIDELLSGFIDDELPARQRTEVERLIAHDPKIKRRLLRLQKCRTLVASLPRAEAPPQILQGIKAALAIEKPAHNQRLGRIHLLGRRMLSAAAMIGLASILGGVIYTIVAPETGLPQREVAVDHRAPSGVEMPQAVSDTSVELAFSGRLELKTSALAEVAAIVNTAIKENGLSDSIEDVHEANRHIRYVRCSREGLNLLLADIENVWSKLDSATMSVDTEVFDEPVTITAVTTEQIGEIVDQDSSEKRIELARDIAVLNGMAERMPGGQILAAIEGKGPSLMTMSRPMITGPSAKAAGETEDEKTVRLTIIISR